MARHNWSKIKTAYVTSEMSQREVAKKYGVSESQLAVRASNEGWVQLRREHRRKVEEKAKQKAAEKKADMMAAQLVDIGTAGENLAALIAEISTETRSLRIGRTKKADTKAIRNLTGSLKDLVDVLRDVYELPTLHDKQKENRGDGAAEVRVVFDVDEEEEDGLDDENEGQPRTEQGLEDAQ